jgi:hypothetical protein
MIKKINVFGLLMVPILAMAITPTEREFQEKENMKMLSDLGLPLPNSGIIIAPRASYNKSKKYLDQAARVDKQRQTLGYINVNTEQPKKLLSIQQVVDKNRKQFHTVDSEKSTDMRNNINDLKLAFVFKHIPKSVVSKYIGVAPMGAFNENGWSGAAEFFTNKDIGTCYYGLMSIPVSQMSARLAAESVSNDINNKVTIIEVSGNKKSGFIYNIQWYDDEYFHNLECANMSFSRKIMKFQIELAKHIDNA